MLLNPRHQSRPPSVTPPEFWYAPIDQGEKASSGPALASPPSFRRKPESSPALQTIVSYKSCQLGLLFSISSNFHTRFQFFKVFSRSMADSMVSWSSYHTN